MITYLHHRIACSPRTWRSVADQVKAAEHALTADSGAVYGIWRSQIGRPRDELNVITAWSGPLHEPAISRWLATASGNILHHKARRMSPTLRPADAAPPTRQGNYAFRFFETPTENWDEFLELCAGAWPGFESAYDSQVIGLWELDGETPELRESLLLTRRPNLAMWERSKLPANADEVEVRRKLSRRYDLCDATVVYTTTLLTATDTSDDARWT